jgi:class 3 adenylate cyclase
MIGPVGAHRGDLTNSRPAAFGRQTMNSAATRSQAPPRRYRSPLTMRRSGARTHYARSGDARIAYQVFGEGPMDLAFVPGFVSNVEHIWELPGVAAVLERFASYARVIMWDKRGTGLSDPVDHLPPLEERMDDMLAVLDAAGSERAALFGVSEGGPLSILFAATHPQRVSALVLYGASPRMARAADYPSGLPEDLFEDEARRQAVLDGWGEGVLLDVFAPSYAADEEMREIWGAFQRTGASPSMGLATLEAILQIDVRDVLPTIAAPTLLLHRGGDRAILAEGSRYMAERIPDARYVELEGSDHLWFTGDVDAIFDEVEEFLTGERPSTISNRMLATVLFTDIVESTRKLTELGDRGWGALLAEHDRAVERELERFRGRAVKTLGDGVMATFDGPARAVACAAAIRDRLRGLGITMRAGVHTGECEVVGADLAGVAVNIAARVSALAGPGEVLVSQTVKDLIYGSGIELEDRGLAELKGLPEQWHLFAATDVTAGGRRGPLTAGAA